MATVTIALFIQGPSVLGQTKHVITAHATADRLDPANDHNHWGLSKQDWTRYEQVMSERRGVWSPGLDPITALGVSTDDRAERRRLAELYVRTEYERTRKELAFQVAVDRAWQRLYPNTPRLATGRGAQAASVEPERYAVVVRPDCPECDGFIEDRLPLLIEEAIDGVDVHVVGTGGDDEVLRAWINNQPLIQAALRAQTITINHGNTDIEQARYPALYRKNGAGQWSRDL
ncbi:MAG: TIGR03759 family integrating conjugative element protein [Pseudomonadota bacterium]